MILPNDDATNTFDSRTHLAEVVDPMFLIFGLRGVGVVPHDAQCTVDENGTHRNMRLRAKNDVSTAAYYDVWLTISGEEPLSSD